MHTISVKFLIRLVSDKDNVDLSFSDDWSFDIGRYHFIRKNDKEVEVNFSFEANLIVADERGQVTLIPSEEMEEFEPYKKEINKILDVLAFSIRRGLKIMHG